MLTVRREGDPLGNGTRGGASQRMNERQIAVPDQLQIRQRIFENSVGESAVHPQGLTIRRGPYAMRRSVHAPLGNPESAGLIRQRDPGYLGALRKIHDRESVEVGKLDEDSTRGPVGIC